MKRWLKKKSLQIDINLQLKSNTDNLRIIENDLKKLEILQDTPNSKIAQISDNWYVKFKELKEKRLVQRERLLKLKKEIDKL